MEQPKTDAIEKIEPTTPRGLLTREALKAETEQRALLAQYVSKHMVEGVDFGTIPGTPKPTLYKPGAEKLIALFHCSPKPKLVKCEEDFERGFFNYIFSIRLVQQGSKATLAEGYGSANSREGRYRWRDAQRKCPACAKATIFQSKNPGEGFFCWRKKGGCGATFEATAPAIVSQVNGKIENDDIATLANTILKMAKKRATVDGAIALACCSDIFTQDVEDLVDPQEAAPPPPVQSVGKQETVKTPINPVANAHAEAAMRARVHHLWERAKGAGVTSEGFKVFVSSVLGSTKASTSLTADEIGHLEAAMPDLVREKEAF